MAEKPTKKSEEEAEPSAQAAAAPKTSLFQRSISVKWLLVVVAVSMALHGATFVYLRLQQRTEPPPGPEVGLGAFHFEADRAEGGRIAQADFSLHVALLEPPDPAARCRLIAHTRHVQQAVEELLRKAHGGDFDDPGRTRPEAATVGADQPGPGNPDHFRSHGHRLEVAADRRAEALGLAYASFASLGRGGGGPLGRRQALAGGEIHRPGRRRQAVARACILAGRPRECQETLS